MEKLFHLKENGTTVKTEIMAGITTFLAMASMSISRPRPQFRLKWPENREDLRILLRRFENFVYICAMKISDLCTKDINIRN